MFQDILEWDVVLYSYYIGVNGVTNTVGYVDSYYMEMSEKKNLPGYQQPRRGEACLLKHIDP